MLYTYTKSKSLLGETLKNVGLHSKDVLDNFRLTNCTTCTVNDKFTSLCIDTFSMCNKALIPVGILPTEISQVIVGGNFLSYLNCNKQTQSRRSLWSVICLKSRKIEVEIFCVRLIDMEIFEVVNPWFLFQVSGILVWIWMLPAPNGNWENGSKNLGYIWDRRIGYSELFVMPCAVQLVLFIRAFLWSWCLRNKC